MIAYSKTLLTFLIFTWKLVLMQKLNYHIVEKPSLLKKLHFMRLEPWDIDSLNYYLLRWEKLEAIIVQGGNHIDW